MNQSRKLSAIETISNVGSGFFVAMGLNLLVAFLCDGNYTTVHSNGYTDRDNLHISINVKELIFRRLFNRI